MAFAFSAAFAGLAGGLYACYLGVLDPSTFGFMKSIEFWSWWFWAAWAPCWLYPVRDRAYHPARGDPQL